MIQVPVDQPATLKTNCLHIHKFKPLVACGLNVGFSICNYESEGEAILRNQEEKYAPTKIMFLESYNALATISVNEISKQTTLYIWKLNIKNQKSIQDNQLNLASKSLLKFQPLNIKFNQQILGIVSLSKIYLFSVLRAEIVHIIDVLNNTRGLLSFSIITSPGRAAIPDATVGVVRVFSMSNHKMSNPIQAHKTQITNVALNPNGTRIATASIKLTSLRIFSAATHEKLSQIKLSGIKNPLLNIQFSLQADWMIVCTKDGSFNLFISQLSKQENSDKVIQLQNPKSYFNFLSSIFKQFNKQLPFAESDSPQPKKVSHCVIRFDKNNDIVLAYNQTTSQYNIVARIRFDPINGGDCSVKSQVTLRAYF